MAEHDGWLHAHAAIHDLSAIRGGPGDLDPFLGVVLHVNVSEHGTPDAFWSAGKSENPYEVCPTFQVMKSAAEGGLRQFLPLNRKPWCQMDGNQSYAAIETAGMPDEELTPYQIDRAAVVMLRAHQWYGVPLQLANKPGERGLGTHEMGGPDWGGHPCPGRIRAHERQKIVDLAKVKLEWYRGHGRGQ